MDKKTEVIAAVDVGSNSIRMCISQVNRDGGLEMLEDLWHPTNIGKDTFAYGRIQVESIHDTCSKLKKFTMLMKDYAVTQYRAVCTSGIREAENREYVLEQIRLRTGLVVEIINNAQERFFMYKAMRYFLGGKQGIGDKGTLIVDIRSGGVEISVYSEGSLKFTEYIKIGSLRLRGILADLERMTLDFPSIVEEFVESRIDFLIPRIKEVNITNFIGLGGELKTINRLSSGKYYDPENKFITQQEIKKLYSTVHSMTTEQIIEKYGLERTQAEILLPSIILFYSFLQMTKAKGIYTPMVSLRQGLIADMADELLDTPRRKEFLNDVISSVRFIGQKYHIDELHCSNIEHLSLSIFDQTSAIHRLGEKERFYLRVAAILHDIGKYVNLNQHDIHSYNIIKFQDIMGFSDHELEIVANVARYHSEEIPSLEHENYLVLDGRDRITVSKLAAILKIAEALDISHKHKIIDADITCDERKLYISVKAKDDILLEKWSFADHINFFEEVMGMEPVVKKRG